MPIKENDMDDLYAPHVFPTTTEECSAATLLTLYLRAPDMLYLKYFEGFRALVYWLGKPKPAIQTYKKLHRSLQNYEIQELAEHLGVSREEVFWTLMEIEEMYAPAT